MLDATDSFRTAILATLGHSPELIEPGRFHRFPTNERRGDAAGWCHLFEDGRAGVFGDFRAGLSEVWTAQRRETMTLAERRSLAIQMARAAEERRALQRQAWMRNSRRLIELSAACIGVTSGDPVSLYFQRRGLGAAVPPCLRLHRALPYWHDGEVIGTFPAMVAPIVGRDGIARALHRTWLTSDGRKADVPTVKKLTCAAGPLAGASIRLHSPLHGVAGIAEGIETAQAAFLGSGVPTVAAYCAGNLAAWQWPVGVRRIVIFADADKAGTDAAQTLKTRAASAGLNVAVMTPTTPGLDWCDVWAQREAVTVTASAAAA